MGIGLAASMEASRFLQAGSAHGAADRRLLERRLFHPADPASRKRAVVRTCRERGTIMNDREGKASNQRPEKRATVRWFQEAVP